MQLKKTSKKIGSLINEVKKNLNGYFSFNNIDILKFTSPDKWFQSTQNKFFVVFDNIDGSETNKHV